VLLVRLGRGALAVMMVQPVRVFSPILSVGFFSQAGGLFGGVCRRMIAYSASQRGHEKKSMPALQHAAPRLRARYARGGGYVGYPRAADASSAFLQGTGRADAGAAISVNSTSLCTFAAAHIPCIQSGAFRSLTPLDEVQPI
jgi:hypothetical protein